MIITRSNGATITTVRGRSRNNWRANPNKGEPSRVRPSKFQRADADNLRAANSAVVARVEVGQPSPSEVVIKYKQKDGIVTSRNITYDSSLVPDPEKIPRDQIKLESDQEKEARLRKVKVAKDIACGLKKEISSGNIPYILSTHTKATIENFTKAFNCVAEKLRQTEAVGDEETLALTAYYCLKTDVDALKKQKGFFEKLPEGLIDPKNENYISSVKILFKHFLIDLKLLDNAQAIEKFLSGKWEDELKLARLMAIKRTISMPDLLKLMLPGYLEGDNPPIRDWLVNAPKIWQGEEGAARRIRACRWVLKYGEKVVNNNGTFNLDAMRKTAWRKAFRKKEYGLEGMLNEYVNSIRDVIKQAAPGLIGLGEYQLKPWEIQYSNMWVDESKDGEKLIDQVTVYLVERKLKCVDDQGRICEDKIKKVKDWAREYNKVALGCLQHSGLKAIQALQRKYSQFFSLKNSQISSDIELIKQAKRGNIDAEEILVERYLGFIQSRARALSGRYRVDEESLVSDVCLKIHTNLIPDFDVQKSQSFKPVLARTIVNTSIDLGRKQKSFHVIASLNAPTSGTDSELEDVFEGREEEPHCKVDALDTFESLRSGLHFIPKHQFVIERLFGVDFGTNPDGEELTTREISERYEINENTVKYIKCTRLQEMRTFLQRSA